MINQKKFKIKALIFDYDDTLVTTINTKWSGLKRIAKEYNLNLTDKDITPHWGKLFAEQLYGIFGDVDSLENLICKCKSDALVNPAKLHNGVKEALEKLGTKYILSILSSGSKDIITSELEVNGIRADTFLKIQSSEDTHIHKPDPKVFEPTFDELTKLNINKSEMIYIGDSLRDYRAATQAGIGFIGITTGLESKEDFLNIDPNMIIFDNISKTLEIL